MKSEAFSRLLAFREQAYQQFHRRADALFEMVDALLTLPTATAPAHMALLPHFQRKWGSIYDALAAGRINATRACLTNPKQCKSAPDKGR